MAAILSRPQYVNGGHQLSAGPGGCCIVGTLGSARSVYSGKTSFWLATADCCNSLHPRFVQRFVALRQIGMCIINVFTCTLTGKFNNDSLWMTISQLFSPHTVAVVHRNKDFIYYQIIVNRFVNHLMTWSSFRESCQIKSKMGWIKLVIASHGQTGKIIQVVLESKRGLRLGAYQGHTYITWSNPGDSVHLAMDLRLSSWFSVTLIIIPSSPFGLHRHNQGCFMSSHDNL